MNEQNNVTNDPRLAETSAYIGRLQALLPVFDEHREHLLSLLTAFGRLDAHRKGNDKLRRAAQKKVDQIQNELTPLAAQLKVLNARLAKARDELTQLARNLLPVAEQLADNYFAVPDALTNLSDSLAVQPRSRQARRRLNIGGPLQQRAALDALPTK